MKIELLNDGLMVIPETDFETQVLIKMYGDGNYTAFIKNGASTSPADLLGLKISNKDKVIPK